ncbi:hypothetical protein LTR27_011650 [Elasticomyces elasticus]|nr:hypothetical protein LTR27_011650 [Elasticomyces elasticus]
MSRSSLGVIRVGCGAECCGDVMCDECREAVCDIGYKSESGFEKEASNQHSDIENSDLPGPILKRRRAQSEERRLKRVKTSEEALVPPWDGVRIKAAIAALKKEDLHRIVLEATKESTYLYQAIQAKHDDMVRERLARVVSFDQYVDEVTDLWHVYFRDQSAGLSIDNSAVVAGIESVTKKIASQISRDSSYQTQENALNAICDICELIMDLVEDVSLSEEMETELHGHEMFGSAMFDVTGLMSLRNFERLESDGGTIERMEDFQKTCRIDLGLQDFIDERTPDTSDEGSDNGRVY